MAFKLNTMRALMLPLLAGCALHASAQSAVQAWVTTGDQAKLMSREKDAAFGSGPLQRTVIDIDSSQRFQEMTGFGASITDASAYLIQKRLNPQQREALMQELFGRKGNGLGLSFTRLTIGSSDFSMTNYSFDDMPKGESDYELKHFSIEPNRAEVLPTVKQALAINPQLKVMASPWSAPGWMKTSDSILTGSLRPEAYRAFAQYLVRYVDAYKAEGIPMFALTLQNEPHFEPADYAGMRVEPDSRAAFIGRHLGPLLEKAHPQTRILDYDHNWDRMYSPAQVLEDKVANKYVDGVAWHCYGGDVRAQAALHDAYPDKETWFTECSGGDWAPDWDENLQFFGGTLMVKSTRGWAKGVLLWNVALDENKGPFVGGCKTCRGIVMIDSKTGAITRNVEYYALAHASRFVRPGAHRIESTTFKDGLDTVAFRNVDGSTALLVANSARAPRSFSVRADGKSFSYTVPARSMATFAWSGGR